MVIFGVKDVKTIPNFYYEGMSIENVSAFTYLGVILTNNGSWSQQVSMQYTKGVKSL